MTPVTKVKLPETAATHAAQLGFEPFAYLTFVRRGVYDATLVVAGTQGVVLVCEGFARKPALERVNIYLANRASKG